MIYTYKFYINNIINMNQEILRQYLTFKKQSLFKPIMLVIYADTKKTSIVDPFEFFIDKEHLKKYHMKWYENEILLLFKMT